MSYRSRNTHLFLYEIIMYIRFNSIKFPFSLVVKYVITSHVNLFCDDSFNLPVLAYSDLMILTDVVFFINFFDDPDGRRGSEKPWEGGEGREEGVLGLTFNAGEAFR